MKDVEQFISSTRHQTKFPPGIATATCLAHLAAALRKERLEELSVLDTKRNETLANGVSPSLIDREEQPIA